MKIFNLNQDAENSWSVTWDEASEGIRKALHKEKLLLSVFQHTNAAQVGFHIMMNSGKHNLLWLDRVLAYDTSSRYGEYIEDMYVITGVTFKKQNDASSWHTWLEKQYIWAVLQT